jgi:hypothetical protein
MGGGGGGAPRAPLCNELLKKTAKRNACGALSAAKTDYSLYLLSTVCRTRLMWTLAGATNWTLLERR